MLDPEVVTEVPLPGSAAAPRQRAGRWFIAAFTICYITMWMALLAPLIITIALKVQLLVGPAAAPGVQALVLGVAALFALIGNPLAGRLSDRTTWRLGMRKPWMIVGAIGGLLSTVLLAVAPSVPVLLLAACLAQLFWNALLAAVIALVPDQIPEAQRGAVSGVLGIGLPVGTVLGTFSVQLVAGNLLLMFLIPAIAAVVGTVILLVSFTDRRLEKAERPAFRLVDTVQSFWVSPRRNPDFAWAWWSRFLLFLGLGTLLTYQAFVLLNKLGLPASQVPVLVFLSTLVQAVAMVITSPLAGRLSDRLRRRKVFVAIAAVVYGIGLAVIAFTGSFPLFLIGMAVTGLGQGAYLAVDLALVTDVLPNREQDAAKDLGVFNIANAAPQSLAPALAPLFLAIGGPNNYGSLFVAAALFAIVGAVLILPVRRVR